MHHKPQPNLKYKPPKSNHLLLEFNLCGWKNNLCHLDVEEEMKSS